MTFYFFGKKVVMMFEWIMDGGDITDGRLLSIGPLTISQGNDDIGYYGSFTPEGELATFDLAAAVGLTVGTPNNADMGWLKFSYKGKVLLIPQKPVRYEVSWADIYTVGCVYGTNDYGVHPYTPEPTLQNTTVVIDGHTFIVRLMSGSDTDPTSARYNRYDPVGTRNSEYSQLFLKVRDIDPSGWDTLTESDLGSRYGGLYPLSWMKDKHTHFGNGNGRVTRGFGGTGGFGLSAYSYREGGGYTTAWRPVLEWVP